MVSLSREQGWYTLLDWYPDPDTLKWFSMFPLIREVAAVTIFARRKVDVLYGPGFLDEAMRVHAEHGRQPTDDGKGEFTARIEHRKLAF